MNPSFNNVVKSKVSIAKAPKRIRQYHEVGEGTLDTSDEELSKEKTE